MRTRSLISGCTGQVTECLRSPSFLIYKMRVNIVSSSGERLKQGGNKTPPGEKFGNHSRLQQRLGYNQSGSGSRRAVTTPSDVYTHTHAPLPPQPHTQGEHSSVPASQLCCAVSRELSFQAPPHPRQEHPPELAVCNMQKSTQKWKRGHLHKLGCVYRIRRHSWTNFSAEKLETLGIRPGGKCGFLKRLREAPGLGGERDLGPLTWLGVQGCRRRVKCPIGPRLGVWGGGLPYPGFRAICFLLSCHR